MTTPTFLQRREAILERISRAALAAGRDPSSITLVAVSKGHGPQAILEALAAGHRDFGESYVQELLPKLEALGDAATQARFHFIGGLQTNKVRKLAGLVHMVQSLDRPALALELAARHPATLPPLRVLLEVHTAPEESKQGCAPQDAPALLAQVLALPNLRFGGLMTVGPQEASQAQRRAAFASLRDLLQRLTPQLPPDQRSHLELSMGMSDDLEDAVAEGATMLRIGTALFGPRNYA
jgi:pyridoxal phosphate enzyme (YggS family)